MRIAFVTGCLESGRDGVGDYTAALAAECERRGHKVCLLSLTERHSEVTTPRGNEWRMAPAQWRADGGAAVHEWLAAFQPDWVSLQFVPYSFDPRGFFGPSIEALANIVSAAPRRHVFFHEIWIGSHVGATVKARLCGWWQRRAVAKLLRRIKPACVHTSIEYYRLALATVGQPAGILHMFGSVPPAAASAEFPLPAIPPNALVCGHFGTLHPDWQPESFLQDFELEAARMRRPPVLIAVGSLGYGEKLFAQVAAEWKDRVQCFAAGRLSRAALAAAFARFDFGVTSVPWNILGKSSSAATMREHGLRVVVTASGSPPRFTTRTINDAAEDSGFVPYFRDHSCLTTAVLKTRPRPGVSAAADQFLRNLHDA